MSLHEADRECPSYPLIDGKRLIWQYEELHRILHRLAASGAYWPLLAVPRDVSGSD